MVGYPESLTDPSYRGQILVLTFPLVGNYGVPSRTAVDETLNKLPLYFESNKTHIAALIVGQYSTEYSHYLADSSLAKWLIENEIPALHGVDTRALTKRIRSHNGALLAKVLFPKSIAGPGLSLPETPAWASDLSNLDWHDPNNRNLVAEVSIKTPQVYKPDPSKAVKKANGENLRVIAVDIGMKNNQIRCFVKRGVEVKVVPWNHDFTKETGHDGIFLSNGPGDPTTIKETIAIVRAQLQKANLPIFGICLGHQVLALAAGASTRKMPFGNRGHNIPCTNLDTGRCFITSQNHGYCVDVDTLPEEWYELFVNANDGSNEGISHRTLPYFSVQFHPESTPGPWDTEYLFDKFIESMKSCADSKKLVALVKEPKQPIPDRLKPRKVLVLGSGGLSIGQAGEFDYSGSQAIKALKEEGIYTVLINPNIATIQTSKGLADKVYFLPVTPEFVRKVIKHEKPDGIYCTFGGQTALNVGVKLKDEFEGLGVKVLGTPIHTIEITEDRELFAQHMAQINEKCAQSESAVNVDEAIAAANRIGYPLIIRAAFALGGLGSGFVSNEAELRELCGRAFATSPQVLVEKSMKGWKEIEYEVVRDAMDNCITVCNMEVSIYLLT
jgi:carbamoyl-phosphate synthase/aspartate carbamoyltransferase